MTPLCLDHDAVNTSVFAQFWSLEPSARTPRSTIYISKAMLLVYTNYLWIGTQTLTIAPSAVDDFSPHRRVPFLLQWPCQLIGENRFGRFPQLIYILFPLGKNSIPASSSKARISPARHPRGRGYRHPAWFLLVMISLLYGRSPQTKRCAPFDSFGGAGPIPKDFRRQASPTGIRCRHPLRPGYLLRELVQESCLRAG